MMLLPNLGVAWKRGRRLHNSAPARADPAHASRGSQRPHDHWSPGRRRRASHARSPQQAYQEALGPLLVADQRARVSVKVGPEGAGDVDTGGHLQACLLACHLRGRGQVELIRAGCLPLES